MSMAKLDKDMLMNCLEPTCPLQRKDHPLRVTSDPSSYRMPSAGSFPTFRDPKDKMMHDPYEFLTKLDRQLKLHAVPPERYGSVLVSCMTDRLHQDWIESNILTTCKTWDEVKMRFRQRYDDPQIKNDLMLQLEKCTQSLHERVYTYTERYQALVVRVSSGAPIDTSTNIVMCERGFIPTIREKLAQYRASETQKQQQPYEFKSLSDLYNVAATVESGLAPRPGRYRASESPHRSRRGGARFSRRGRINNVQTQRASTPPPAAVNKIEMNEKGKPFNANKKHKKRVRMTSPPPSSTGSSRGGYSGGNRGRGGAFRGRGGSGTMYM